MKHGDKLRDRARHLPLVVSLLVAALVATVWQARPATAETGTPAAQEGAGTGQQVLELDSVEDLFGKRLGMTSGAAYDVLITQAYDEIDDKDFTYYNSVSELVGALKAGKIDAFVTDLPLASLAVNRNDGIAMIEEPLITDHYGLVLQKDSPLTPLFDERIRAMREDGSLEALSDKWAGPDDAEKTMPDQDWDAPNGTITCVTPCDSEPISFLANNEPVGTSVELVELIARDLGYRVKVRVTNSPALISEVQAGKADVAAHAFSITEERKQMVDMTDSYFDGGIVAVVRCREDAPADDQGRPHGLVDSFERTLVTEDRWQLIASGLGVTLLISVCSGALGFGLGLLLVLVRHDDTTGVADRVIRGIEGLLGGLPTVVVLMVFYYVVFGSVSIPGTVVAIIAFSITFGSSSGAIMWNAIRAVDAGQREGSLALGFTERDTFLHIVMPQAARQFNHNLLSHFVALVKDTSIVGYIAVQDLTRAGDLIRARTMDAFFPVIVCAVIYFALCSLLTFGLGRMVARFESKSRRRIVRGVQM